MRLYLVQHGDSVPKEVDPDRPLSDRGRRDAERLARFLSGQGLQVARVIHSGKTRARQTAELLAAAFGKAGQVEPVSGLEPLDSPVPFAFTLGSQTEDLVVVGHLPHLQKLVSFLILEREDTAIVALLPGSIVCLERGQDKVWTVNWMLRPELLPQ